MTPFDSLNLLFSQVSIHTPTWGVTSLSCNRCRSPWSFNPHTYMRCDSAVVDLVSSFTVFQSTHLHEVWHYQATKFLRHRCFNPHTYMRCDIVNVRHFRHIQVSIHTPTWGVTFLHFHRHHTSPKVSIHTPTWGVTCGYFLWRFLKSSFNPHTYMRCDARS